MKFIFYCLIAMMLWSPVALAAGGEDNLSDSPWGAATRKALDAKDWSGAINLLKRDVAANSATADTHNYIGYAYRKLGKFDLAFKHYGLALKMNPEHRGAHEYVGETYLAVGNLAKAKEHLAALDSLCFFGCKQYDDLKAAIAAYRPK
ncbi:MAG: tetratricopeptide repeat protein [Alphaproteobacteria bacterium]|jgi:tetratricopeptide (TPR) repeat protein|nr:tetratricopeptide repeat protein [Alphaproteobacteria bacterium]